MSSKVVPHEYLDLVNTGADRSMTGEEFQILGILLQ